MIKRYDVTEISNIWADESKYTKMLEVELAILEALEDKMVPKGTAAEIRAKAEIRPSRVDEIEKVTKHDIIAFVLLLLSNLQLRQVNFSTLV